MKTPKANKKRAQQTFSATIRKQLCTKNWQRMPIKTQQRSTIIDEIPALGDNQSKSERTRTLPFLNMPRALKFPSNLGVLPTLFTSLAVSVSLASSVAQAAPWIVDTDMGTDDWIALLFLARQQRETIAAITVSGERVVALPGRQRQCSLAVDALKSQSHASADWLRFKPAP